MRTLLTQLASQGVEVTALTGPAFDARTSWSLNELGARWLPQEIADSLLHIPSDDFRHYISPLGLESRVDTHIVPVIRQELSQESEILFSHTTVTMLGITQPDVLLIFGGGVHERALIHRAKRMGIVTVFYLTNPNYHDRSIFENVDVVITDSQSTRDLYRDRLGLDLKVVGKFIEYPTLPDDSTRDQVLFVNPHPEKGVMLVLAVIKELRSRDLGAPFCIVESRAELAPALIEFGTGADALSPIKVVPSQPSLQGELQRTSILLLPSLWHESGSRTILEASAHGIPIVASNRGGTSELLDGSGVILPIEAALDGSGWSVPAKPTITRWADAVERLLADDSYYAVKRSAALRRWRSYKIDRSTKKFLRAMNAKLK